VAALLRETLAAPSARPFREPVDTNQVTPPCAPRASPPHSLTARVLARGAQFPDYLDFVESPMDLGTILTRLLDGGFQTASDVHREVTRVWANCEVFNGKDAPITLSAMKLARRFDRSFKERVPVPEHMGMKTFPQGDVWIGHETLSYWDGDKTWYPGKIGNYRNEGTKHEYLIRYDDGEDEWFELPCIQVAIVDNWEGITEPVEPWDGVDESRRGRDRPQRARQAVKQFNPSMGFSQPRAKRAKLEDETNTSKLADDDDDDDAPDTFVRGAGYLISPAAGAAGEFICDDGMPCGQVREQSVGCATRALYAGCALSALHRARSRLNAGARRRCAAVECSFGAGSAYAGAPDRPGVTSCPRCRVRSLDANTHKPSLWRHGDSLDRKCCTQNMGRAPHSTLPIPMRAHHSKSSSHTASRAGHRACTRRSREPTCTQSGYGSRYALASWMRTLSTSLQSLRSWGTDQHDRSPLKVPCSQPAY
jgi:hypothetical protein